MQQYTKLHPTSVALSFGLLWGVGLLLVGWFASLQTGYGNEFIHVIGSVYIGYEATFWGAVNGLFWGFIDAFVFGIIYAWVYNYFTHKFTRQKP